MVARNIIVIGASAGGFEAVPKLVGALPADLKAAVFVTMHLFERSEGILPEILNRAGPLLALHPWEETPIQPGHVYVAPPDYHLVINADTVQVGHGPKENLQRPCINTMFRSAALSHGEHVVGVLLTGLLDDGAAGLWEIQQRGGATLVQDPEEAQYRSMPESAIRGLNVQYIQRLEEMPSLLTRLTMGEKNTFRDVRSVPTEEEATMQACPECGGAMKLFRHGRLKEYCCHVGHRFGLKTMIAEKTGVVERAMWTALSQSEELSDLLQHALEDAEPEHVPAMQEELEQRKKEQQLLRTVLENAKVPSVA
jgi:two-component system, chemotaxis family, protein-glutamate methylesterase/glutaminase